ncbi:pilus assembly protein N-terminal domain-containing protein [Rhizobium sp. CFBP 8762]|uniref:pilus assembly protein N-terminal domain-containing protein n=1 Tax=Rhizobium sp. CFBP 8762 TaxID=2775279 RepID=UPI00177DC273|nr:pilus assembly protein N-terminal domain-containing protein [Rhizobium sp. CFBP 8762]MBD8555344.1 pilus assembly protein N-terminal domain-containing protein [Rhizobium sp. CFBP 8762]
MIKIIVLILASLAFSLSGTAIQANDGDHGILRVYKDQSRILKLDRPALRVIVGSSEVADVAVADPQTVVVTGKNYGATNLVIIDSDGNTLLDERVLVSIDEGNTVRLYQSTGRTVLSCTPSCEQHRRSQ